jgi:exosortase D (VPLPA-CTERM-specific)
MVKTLSKQLLEFIEEIFLFGKNNGKFILLLILWVTTFIPIYPSLVNKWVSNVDNSYGIYVILVSLFFIWQKREELKRIEISNSNWGGVILILSMGLYILSYAGGIAVIARGMISLSLIGLVLFTLGKTIFKILAFPLLFLFFMVPVPDSILGLISFPLQIFSTKLSAFILQTISIPVFREGNMLYFAQTQLEVAEACSGIRSIMSFFMLSFMLAHVSRSNWTLRSILIISAIPLAFCADILRVSGTGILAHFFGAKVATGFLHEFSGFLTFFFGFMVLWGIFLIIREKDSEQYELKAHNSQLTKSAMSKKSFIVSLITFFVTICLSILIAHRGEPVVVKTNLENIPMEIGGYKATEDFFSDAVYKELNADKHVYRHYRDDLGNEVDLYIGYYGTAKGGRTPHNPYGCLPGAGWGITDSKRISLKADYYTEGVPVNYVLALKDDRYNVMLHWYQSSKTKVISGGIQHNIKRFMGKVFANRDDGAFVRISAISNQEHLQKSTDLLVPFAEKVLNLLPGYWPLER